MNLRLIVEAEGERADLFLSRQLTGTSRAAVQRLIEEGNVTRADAKPLRKNDKLQPGAVLLVDLPEAEPTAAQPEDIPLEIRYEDEDVIVINKPVGLVVHPAPGHPGGTLVNALLHHCKDSLSGIGGELRPGIVHRIDRDTSGLLIVAKNDLAHLSLSAQLQDHSLYREYECVVVGHMREDSGTVDAPIGRHTRDRKRMAIERQNGREAITHWEVLMTYPRFTHLRCRLETGRTHQIRVHLASLGHAVLGDVTYGLKKPFPGLVGQCLHAKTLCFTHPKTGERIRVESELPAYFTRILEKISRE